MCLITLSVSMYIMCVILCLFIALSRKVGALRVSIIIIVVCVHFKAVVSRFTPLRFASCVNVFFVRLL